MANHLTPEELSHELGIDRDAIIKLCIEEGVPIYHGKIDKHLFQVQLQAAACPSRSPPDPADPDADRVSPPLARETPCVTQVAMGYFGAARPLTSTRGRDFAAGFLAFAAGFAGLSPPVFAASTLALSASSRSTAGAAGASGSSGGGSSTPSSFASSSALRSRR